MDHPDPAAPAAEAADQAIDPVCGMRVDPTTARHRFAHDGREFVFCCAGCRDKFAADPARYLAPRTDPVCGMRLDPTTATHRFRHEGQSYLFCGAGCRDKFAADPARYLADAPTPPTAPGTIFTCPMDPEIRQDHPGACPLCGMALEPLTPGAGPAENPELAEMARRLAIGLAFAVPVFVLAMAPMLPGHAGRLIGPRVSALIQFLLATPAALWAGSFIFVRGWRSLRNRSLNMFSLIALGVGVAWLYSTAATFMPFLFPAGFRDAQGAVATYFESAAVITVLVILGQVLELRARDQTGSAIRALLDLAPKTTRRLAADGTDEEVPLDRVRPGDRLRVRPGEAIPVDGAVLEGRGAVDESMVTGEAMPVAKEPGAALIGGTVNGTGALLMRAEKVGAETVLARIIALVAEAQRSRAPIQRIADMVSGWFVPAVVAAALASFVLWAIWGPAPALAYGLLAGVAVLIVACPCALGLATPMSIQVGIGKGAGAGVLIRSAEALERMERADTLVLDKTGTLTEGRPRLVAIVAAPGFAEGELLRLAASLERASEHPLAGAILREAAERAIALAEPADFVSVTGQGVRGRIDGHRVALGNAALLAGEQAAPGALAARADALRADGATALFIAVDGTAAGVLAIADPIKPTARAALDALRRDGMRVVMLTGDNRRTAEAVARRLGIEEIEADVLPEQKHAAIRKLREAGRVVAMAGDGVNDAPALAAADIGIAMGTGTEAAIRSAGITLVKGDLIGIVRARALSRATMRNIRQNLFFAFAYNAIGVPVAAGVLYPWFGVLLSPALAALAMALSSFSVVSNALRLRRLRLEAIGG